MATLRIGTVTPTALRLGTLTVTAAYLGTVQVWTTGTGVSATLPASGKSATATINSTYGAPPVTGTIPTGGRSAVATINGTISIPFAKYRTFNGTTGQMDWTLGNLAGVGSVPSTLVFVARLLGETNDGIVLGSPGFDPVDLFYIFGDFSLAFTDGSSALSTPRPTWRVSDGWCLFAFRTLTGTASQWSKSVYSGTAWPTPTNLATVVVYGNRPWPTTGTVMMGNNGIGTAPLSADVACVAVYNRNLSNAEINSLTGGAYVMQATPGITNLWMLGRSSPIDVAGTSILSSSTGTTLSSADSPFLDGVGGGLPSMTGTISASGQRATASLAGTYAAGGAAVGTLPASGKSATAVINTTYAPPPATGTITASGRSATAVINATHAGAALYTDDFNRADQNLSANANWTTESGNEFKVVSNHLCTSAPPQSGNAHHNGVMANDQWAEVVITATATGSAGGVIIRRNAGIDNSIEASWIISGGSSHYEMYKNVGGSYSQLGSDVTAPGSGTKKLRIQAIGTTITLYVDDVSTINVTGVTGVTAGTAGLWADSVDQTRFFFDNFRCGDTPYTP